MLMSLFDALLYNESEGVLSLSSHHAERNGEQWTGVLSDGSQ